MRNFTLRLDDETIRVSKILAARQGVSVSRLLADAVARMALEDSQYDAAAGRILERLAHPPGYRTEGKTPSRAELHDRQGLR